MHDGRPFSDSTDDLALIHAFQKPRKICVLRRILADNGIFDSHADSGVDEAADGVQPGVFIGAEVILLLAVEHQRRLGGVGEFAETLLQSRCIPGIAARQAS